MAWTLLIVEDDDDIAETLDDVFTTRGYRVWRARHGRDALDTVARHGFRPDAILLDVLMPVMDGVAFLEARKEHRLLSGAPVIVLTAQRNELGDPVFEYLDKPARLEVLIDAVHRACHRDAAARPR